MKNRLSYAGAGVDIDSTDAAKRRMARSIDSDDPRVFNKLGAFASLVDATFPGVTDPVLVLKTDEPGSKQKLAFQLNRIESLCEDLVNHIVNDIAVMGAHPLYLLDCIVGGSLEGDVVNRLVAGMANACRQQGCVLVGGETSVQPGVIEAGIYVLSATAIGVAERAQVIDGSKIREDDVVLAVASNGLHTNGYTLVRALLDSRPEMAEEPVDGTTFVEAAMRPHLCYYPALRGLYGDGDVHGLAHITGGGLRDNIARILPERIDARVDLSLLRIPEIFRLIRRRGDVDDADILRTFNLGCGLAVLCAPEAVDRVTDHFGAHGMECWQTGEVGRGSRQVLLEGQIPW